jgi:hypothetical protein
MDKHGSRHYSIRYNICIFMEYWQTKFLLHLIIIIQKIIITLNQSLQRYTIIKLNNLIILIKTKNSSN